jgi:hypothetical protein
VNGRRHLAEISLLRSEGASGLEAAAPTSPGLIGIHAGQRDPDVPGRLPYATRKPNSAEHPMLGQPYPPSSAAETWGPTSPMAGAVSGRGTACAASTDASRTGPPVPARLQKGNRYAIGLPEKSCSYATTKAGRRNLPTVGGW